ncbi:MAG: aspartate/glutamate racemase family protein [Thermodesulfobacteriota bacterium]
MKIKVIIPVSTNKWDENVESDYKRIKHPETSIHIVHLSHGPEAIQSEYDEANVTPFILEEVSVSVQKAYHAIIIYCFSDPALAASREISTLPVLGIGESSQLFAMALADRIGILATVEQTIPKIRRKLAARGISSRFPSIQALNIPVLEYDHPEKVLDQARRTASLMVNQDRVEALILGCGSLFNLKERLEEDLSLPVVVPGEVALKHAEMVVELGLSHSKKSFMTPLPVKMHGLK